MRRIVIVLTLSLAAVATSAASLGAAIPTRRDALSWPEVTSQSRPWTRWWWLGSAVTEAEITRQLEAFKAAGFGGVEVSPIYGAKGAEDRYLAYLGPEWVRMLRHTVREGNRLGLGVDMIQGTGWPFGGPWVPQADAAQRMAVTELAVDPEGKIAPLAGRTGAVVCVMAFPKRGEAIDLTDRVRETRIDWTAPGEGWTVYAVQSRPTGQKVKRAGPGGDGPVLDPFGAAASRRYFAHFEPVLAAIPPAERPRALFNDSFEAFGANWTPDLLAEFQRRRGYDVRRHLPSLVATAKSDRDQRVRADYRQTVSELLLEDFTRPWNSWAHGLGMKTRNQAHGSPGNLLDLYAAADIPETEMFGPARRGEGAKSGWRDIMVCKLASSAAHVTGKPLISSESMTWLGEHFQVSLADMKQQADTLFLSGVNHLFFHGTPFSPADAEWPGWLFYASTEVSPTNTWWRDLPALNQYIARCQAFLQSGRPDNDVLLYFPMHDLQARDEGSQDLLQYIRVHNTETWLDGNAEFAKAARQLWELGYGFDFVSDAQLREAVAPIDGRLAAKGGDYRVLLIAGCSRMPPSTMNRVIELARAGCVVGFVGTLPKDVPGLEDLELRRRQLSAAIANAGLPESQEGGIKRVTVGKGLIFAENGLEHLLRQGGVGPDPLVECGLQVIRRKDGGVVNRFVRNNTDEPIHVTFPVSGAPIAGVFDPMTGRSVEPNAGWPDVASKSIRSRLLELTVQPGESFIVRTRSPSDYERQHGLRKVSSRPTVIAALGVKALSAAPTSITGPWRVEFISGGPELPRPALLKEALTSWTTWPGAPELQAFSGTARYKFAFPMPERKASGWVLDLGTVHNSAHVQLNGRSMGTVFAPPYRVAIPAGLLRARNEMQVEVSNLMANRIAEMDRRKTPWQKFYFVNIDYKPFNAASWEPLPSGLLGPVRLLPHKAN